MTSTAARPVRMAWLSLAAAVLAAVLLVVAPGDGSGAVGVAGAQGQTTSTFPIDNRSFGDIVPEPNTGVAPQDPGDPGGWLQVSLFFLVCAAILVIVGLVWWTSRRARDRRRAAGLDDARIAAARNVGPQRGGATRRSTRSEPVADTSSNSPDRSAGR